MVEAEVCRAAAFEVIAHEAQTGRSALNEAFTTEPMEFGRLLKDSRMATAMEVRDALRSELEQEWQRRERTPARRAHAEDERSGRVETRGRRES